ncbi:hypothetical protein quinque_004597 [Culex quinquefasciatus]
MNSTVPLVLALVCIPFRETVQSLLPGILESLVTNVIQVGSDVIQDREESKMEIWLFKSSNSGSYSEALLDRLIAAEPFAGHPKILLDEFSAAEELFAIPPDTGFLSQHEIANIILQKQLNVDRRTGRTRFIMLEERLGSNLAFFYFGLRNPLKSRFAQLQQRVYESGLNQHWIRTFAAQQSFRAVVDEPPKMIRFEQLQQLAMVFVVLWMCCTIVFLLEMASYWLKKSWHKMWSS